MKNLPAYGLMLASILSNHALGSFVTYKNDKQGWIDAVGANYTTLDFNFGQSVILSDQYASLGVVFPESDDNTWKNDGSFLNDGWGVKGGLGNPGTITLQFLTPQNWLAMEYPGLLQIDLFYQDKLIFSATGPIQPTLSPKFFGLVGLPSFDKAVLSNPFNGWVNCDDIYFGAPIPGPAGLTAFAVLGLLIRNRRR